MQKKVKFSSENVKYLIVRGDFMNFMLMSFDITLVISFNQRINQSINHFFLVNTKLQ